MGIVSWVLVGILIGGLAGLLMHGSGYGVVGDIILGIIGALISGFLAAGILGTRDAVTNFNLLTAAAALVGAFACVAVIRAIARPTTA